MHTQVTTKHIHRDAIRPEPDRGGSCLRLYRPYSTATDPSVLRDDLLARTTVAHATHVSCVQSLLLSRQAPVV